MRNNKIAERARFRGLGVGVNPLLYFLNFKVEGIMLGVWSSLRGFLRLSLI